MGIRLRGDIFFSDPESRIREYCEIEVYDGYDDRHTEDNIIRQVDIDSANNLYAMIDRYDKTESRRILEESGKLSSLLAEIPHKPIHQYNDEEWTKLKPKIQALLKKMTSIHGVGVAKSTKILHLKRPELFPVLDNYVVQFLTGKPPTSSHRDINLAMNSLDISRDLIKTQISEFTELQKRVKNLPIPLMIVRLFDILCWSTYKWDILKRTTAPKGNASKSLINYSKRTIITTPRKALRPSTTSRRVINEATSSMASSIVIDFFNELSGRAKYRVKGEKPLAVLAVLKYLMDTKQMGVRFLDLLDYPYYEKLKKTFINVAEKCGSLSDPSNSWNVITGTDLELQNAIISNGKVNQAVADLSSLEIEKTYQFLLSKYSL